MLVGRNTSAKNQKLVGKEGNGSTIMGNERRRGMMASWENTEESHSGQVWKKKNRRRTERGD